MSNINIPYYFIEMFRFYISFGLNAGLVFISFFSPLHLINSQLKHCYLREIFPDPYFLLPVKVDYSLLAVSGCSLIFHCRINHIVFWICVYLVQVSYAQ